MAKGPLMPPWMRQVVVETYLQMEIEAARAPTAKEVHARILEIQGKGQSLFRYRDYGGFRIF